MLKHLFISVLVLAAAMPLGAQTAKNPLPVTVGGENKYEYGGGYSTPVWMYTAPEDQLVTITPVSNVEDLKVTVDGDAYTTTKRCPSLKYKDSYLFVIQKDASLYLNITGYKSPIEFTAAARERRYSMGTGVADAIEIVADGEPVFIPFREENYSEVPVYMKYIATDDGALEITALGYIFDAYFADGAAGEFTGITCKRDGDNYRTFFPVENGKTYYFHMKSTSAKMVKAELTHPVYGESADYPIVISGTEAEVPAKAGTYYYEVTGTESGYAVLGSTVTDLDGSVTFGQIVTSSRVTVDDGSFDLRQPATLGGHYVIVVTKRSDTPAPQKFTVRFEPAQPYDAFTTAAAIPFDTDVALPPYPGTYYYRATIPATGAYILKAGPKTAFTESGSDIRLFRTSDSSTPLYIGEPDIYTEVEAGNDYIIRITYTEADKRNSLTASLQELQKGDGASDPFELAVGTNNLAVGDAKYYAYRAAKSSWATVTPADMGINAPTVKRLKTATSPEQTVAILRHGDGYRFEVEAGQSYLLRFTKVKAPTTFDFAVPDYAQGESRDNPFTVDGAAVEIPSAPGTYWWRYTAPRTGKLHISTDFKYDVVSSPTRENAVKLCADPDGAVLTTLPVDYTEEIFNPVAYNVGEGRSYLLQIISVSEQQGKTLTLDVTDLDPGETPAVAIALTTQEVPFEYTVVKNTSSFYSGPRWYSIELEPGTLSIYSRSSISFYMFAENEQSNYTTSNYFCYGASFRDDDSNLLYGMRDKAIPAAGRYLIAMYYIYADAAVTFDGTAIKKTSAIVDNVAVGEPAFTVSAGRISAADAVSVYDLSGRLVRSVAAGETAALAPGVYIVRSAATASKIIVR